MTVFDTYARYYDLLYRDKDYAAEAAWIHDIIRSHSPSADSVLEIGCGTGAHASELARLGMSVHGVDRSEAMLEAAEARRESLPAPIAGKMAFSVGDAVDFRLGRKFDVVISLFHVMSYQTTNKDLLAALTTASVHLAPGGIFIFDCWYGPAVLVQQPSVTRKEFRDSATLVTRVAEPELHQNENVVDVRYTIRVDDTASGASETFDELHRMRYFFTPELAMALQTAGLRMIESRAWLTEGQPRLDTWAACYVACS